MTELDYKLVKLLGEVRDTGKVVPHAGDVGKNIVSTSTIVLNLGKEFPVSTIIPVDFDKSVHELLWSIASYDSYDTSNITSTRYLLENGINKYVGLLYDRYRVKVARGYVGLSSRNKLTLLSVDEFVQSIITDDEFASQYGNIGPCLPKQLMDWGGYKSVVDENINYRDTSADMLLIDKIDTREVYINGVKQLDNLISSLVEEPNKLVSLTTMNVSDSEDTIVKYLYDSLYLSSEVISIADRISILVSNVPESDITGYMGKINVGSWKDITRNPLKQIKILDHFNVPSRRLSMVVNVSDINITGVPELSTHCSLLLHAISTVVDMVPEHLTINMNGLYAYTNEVLSYELGGDDYKYSLLVNKDVECIHDFRIGDFKIKTEEDK